MDLHPALAEKLNIALAERGPAEITRRDVQLPDMGGKVHAVIGMRRTGKTTFLRQLVAQRRTAVGAARALYLSFDDDRLANIDHTQLDLLLEAYYRRHPSFRGAQRVSLFLDEIQLVPGWEPFVRRVLDTEDVEIVVSGSSAKMLSREIHTSLRGRGLATVMRPFSFRELLRHRGEEPTEAPDFWLPAQRSNLERRVREYLREGGFPEVQGRAVALRTTLLQGYVDTVLFRDVVERHEVTQISALRWIVRHLLRSPAGLFSVHRLHADLRAQGHSVAKEAVHTLVAHIEDAFLIERVALETDSERQRNSNPRKAYPADPGLIHAFSVGRGDFIGQSLETVVFHELRRRGAEITYVRTPEGFEVDFLARWPDGTRELIQVCADTSDPSTGARELRALQAAAALDPEATPQLIVLQPSPGAALLPGAVVEQPIHRWLLQDGRGALP